MCDGRFGENKFPPAPHKSWFELFWGAFEDTTIVILVIAATISLVLGVTLHVEEEGVGWVEGAAIFIAVLIVATVTSTNEYQKEKQFRQLNDVKNDKPVKVIRGGREFEVSIKEVLVGDVVKLATGDAIVGDGLCISGHGTCPRLPLPKPWTYAHVFGLQHVCVGGCRAEDGRERDDR